MSTLSEYYRLYDELDNRFIPYSKKKSTLRFWVKLPVKQISALIKRNGFHRRYTKKQYLASRIEAWMILDRDAVDMYMLNKNLGPFTR